MSRSHYRRLRAALLRLLIPCLIHTVGRLPYGGVRRFGKALGWILFKTNRRYRRRSLEHLAIAFPELSEGRRLELCRQCFEHSALNAAEALQLFARGRDVVGKRVTAEGWEHVERERQAGQRFLLLTCHAAFWELLMIACARRDLDLIGFGRRSDDPLFRELVLRIRRVTGGQTIERGTSGTPGLLRRALSGKGAALVMLIDQDTKVDGVWVPFFGRPAYTPTGAAEIALRHDIRVIPAFVARDEDGRHIARFQPALELPDDVEGATALMTKVTEEHIRKHPAQWVWWHRRWRRQPPG